MKKTGRCPKCGAADIAVVPPGRYNSIPVGFGGAKLERYICLSCGFTEEWVETAAMEKGAPILWRTFLRRDRRDEIIRRLTWN